MTRRSQHGSLPASVVVAVVVSVCVVLLSFPAVAFGARQEQSSIEHYVVRRGDTLADIAYRLGISASALARANGITNYDRIYTGQSLTIPHKSAAPAAKASPTPVAGQPTASKPPLVTKPTVTDQPAATAATQGAGIKPTAAPAKSSAVPAPNAAAAGKWIDVDLTQQRLTAYEGEVAVFTTLASTGTAAYPTPTGTFKIQDHLLFWDMSGPGYYLRDVPNVMHFKSGGFAIHGTYWHKNFGHPISHGCVNLSIADSAWVYNWAPNGTRVVIHK